MTLPSIEHLVSPEIFSKFKIYERLLREWNLRTNLVQHDTLDHFWVRHILDSLQILPLVVEYSRALLNFDQGNLLTAIEGISSYDPYLFNASSTKFLDIGSGAGFPGMVLAICGFRNVTLCESNHKKCIFLEEVARQTGTQVIVLNQRVEDISETYDVIVSRAMTDLVSLCSLMASLMASLDTIGIFHKGRRWKEEVDQAHIFWSFESQCFPSVTSDEGVILLLSSLEKIDIHSIKE